MVLLIFFFLFLCVAMPLGEVTRVTFGLTVSFTLLDIVVTAGSLVWLVLEILKKKKPHSAQAKTFLLVIIVFALSLLMNILNLSRAQFLISGLYIVRFLVLGIIFFIVKGASDKIKKKLLLLLLFGGGLLVLSGFVQYFFYPSLRNLIYFGWDEHFYRMFGTFFDPNFFGLFLVLFFLFLLSTMFALSPQKQKMLFSSYFLGTSATFVAIFLTYSRSALVALIVGLLVLFWNRHFWKWFWVFSLAAIITTGVLFIASTKTKDVNSFFRTTSADARIGSAKNALKIFMDNPMFGVGFNAYRYAQYRYHFMTGSPIQEDHGASGADSSLLLVLATSGTLGLFSFLLFLASHVHVLLKSKKRIGLATLISLFIGSFFVNGLFYPLLLVWLWVILGITESDGL